MRRSMYSLILSDSVVRGVDQLAETEGVSRSALINRILAGYLGMLTPEQRVEEIYQNLLERISGSKALQVQNADSGVFSVRGILDYKYNPIIRYDVAIQVEAGEYTGELRVVSRSQSEALLQKLHLFFEIWSRIEEECIQDRALCKLLRPQISTGRLRRRLLVQCGGQIYDTGRLGEAIGGYIDLLDRALKLYFSFPCSGCSGVDRETYGGLVRLYQSYLNECDMVI